MSPRQRSIPFGIDRTRVEQLKVAISELAPRYRTVIVLTDIEGHGCEEVAEIMHSTVRTVKSDLRAARSLLGERLYAYLRRVRHPVPESAGENIVAVTQDFQRVFNEIIQRPGVMHDLAPHQFEELVAEIWARFGYKVELTKRTRDGGRDIIAVGNAVMNTRLLIECKKYMPLHKVGVGIVRALYGVKTHEGATKAILATTSSLTADAREFVGQHRWELEARDQKGGHRVGSDRMQAWL